MHWLPPGLSDLNARDAGRDFSGENATRAVAAWNLEIYLTSGPMILDY